MTMIRGRSAARWLPSRHHFALSRLVAFLYLRFGRPRNADANVALAIDRDQSAFENPLLAIWVVLTMACYASVTLFPRWPVAVSLVLGIPVAIVAMHVPIVVTGLLLKNRNNIALNSKILMLLLVAAAIMYSRSPLWVRFVAWQFLALVALDAVAAAAVFLLRKPIANLEESFAG